MKIKEIADVAVHPAVKAEQEFVNLLNAGEERWEDMVEFVMDDRNAESRRLYILARLDELQGDRKDHYDASDLEEFMHDQGELDPAEADAIDREMRVPPYHLKSVDESDKEKIHPHTGEYTLCAKCYGDGCHYCNDEGLIDTTGEFRRPDFGDEE